jgi:CRP-like cAMP-binding protein
MRKQLLTMFDQLIEKLKKDKTSWEQFQGLLVEKDVPAKTVLLQAGEISHHAHFIKTGCLRQWFNKDGKDITVQFFFEGQVVASIDSFMNNQPSLFSIESIEPSTIISIGKADFEKISDLYPEFKGKFHDFIFLRFRNYAQLFLSRIKDSPKERYEDLIKNCPEIIRRVPQHYIASYLGITPISLSRIRNRK